MTVSFAAVERLRALRPAHVVAACAIVVAAALAFAALAHRESRVALFSTPLAADQLRDVDERLAGWNVPYTPTNDNVLVERTRRHDILLRLSLAGVPRAHLPTSTESFGKLGAFTPQAVVDAQTREGLASELALALRGIAGILEARVIIAPAKAAFFADERGGDASASVRLSLAPGAALAGPVVAGIRRFIAGGVPGLDGRRVTILDDRGVALGEPAAAAQTAGGEIAGSLQSALDAAFGAGNTIVRVRVETDDREREIRESRHAPALAHPVRRASVDERWTDDRKRYTKLNAVDDRGFDAREERATYAAGRVARISTAVFVDASHAMDVPAIRALSAAAIGAQSARGDALTVEVVHFARAAIPRANPFAYAAGSFVPLLPPLLFAAILIVAFRTAGRPGMALVRGWLRRAELRDVRRQGAGFPPAHVRGALRDEPPHTAAAVISALPAHTAAAVLELYAPEERAAIVRRMARPNSPLLPDCESLLGKA